MSKTVDLLGQQAEYYLNHTCKTIDKKLMHVPGPDVIDKIWVDSDRNVRTLNSLQALYGHGRLANTGYVSILPVDQDIEHTAGASFAPNPIYFDPENIVKLAIEGGCNAVASTFGILGAVARKYAHKIPFVADLSKLLRSGDVWNCEGSMEYGCSSCWRHNLFRFGAKSSSDY